MRTIPNPMGASYPYGSKEYTSWYNYTLYQSESFYICLDCPSSYFAHHIHFFVQIVHIYPKISTGYIGGATTSVVLSELCFVTTHRKTEYLPQV